MVNAKTVDQVEQHLLMSEMTVQMSEMTKTLYQNGNPMEMKMIFLIEVMMIMVRSLM